MSIPLFNTLFLITSQKRWTSFFLSLTTVCIGHLVLKQKKTIFFFSLFKGRGTQSQFLETFYDFMNFDTTDNFYDFKVLYITYLQSNSS